jgi:hypothetical protein
MRTFIIGTCLAAASATASAMLPSSFKAPAASELTLLRALDRNTSSLADLRAGKGDAHAAMSATERSCLERAQAQNLSLADLRAGEISNDTLLTVLLVLAIVLVVLIII